MITREFRVALLNLNLFGRYGSGKGTQTELLAKKYNLGILGTGAIIREEIQSGGALAQKFQTLLEHGQLISDEDIFTIFKKFFETYPQDQGIIFDGVPRTLEQKKFFDEYVASLNRTPLNIEIEISEETSLSRQINRNEARDDQKEEVARERVRIYEEKIQPMVNAYKAEGKMLAVPGEQPIEKVFEDICKLVELHGNRNE